MKITWTFSNIQDTIAQLGVKRDKIIASSRKGLIKGMEYFKADVIINQLSGRSNRSLGRVTGYAARSWEIKAYDTNFGGITVVKLQTEAPYLKVHQTGSKDWDGTFGGKDINGRYAKRVVRQIGTGRRHNIPKRLHVYEDFKEKGPALLDRSVCDEVSLLR
jgi:hypothetical protein